MIALSCTLDEAHTEHNGPCGLPISVFAFTVEEMKLSSTWRELKALEDLYCVSGHLYQGKGVLHLTDSKAVKGIMRKGVVTITCKALPLRSTRPASTTRSTCEFSGVQGTTPGFR